LRILLEDRDREAGFQEAIGGHQSTQTSPHDADTRGRRDGEGTSRGHRASLPGRYATFRRPVNGPHLLLYAVLVLFAWASGAALLAWLLAKETDAELVSDAALSLGLPLVLLAAALPGWLLTAVARVPVDRVAVPLGGLALGALLVAFFKSLVPVLKGGKRLILPLAIFLGALGVFLWLRYTMGDIRQTEKPMDFAILNALLTSPSLPIGDPWMAGARFSYYHFGTWVVSLPMRVAGVAPEVAYNLFAALLAAMAASAGFAAIR